MAKNWIERWLQHGHIGFEFGSGLSTLWLGVRIKSLVSVEHSPKWYKKVKGLIEQSNVKNIKLIYRPNLDTYPTTINGYPDHSFDFVFVDGRRRVECVRSSKPKVKPGGLLILDDSRRSRYKEVFNIFEGWERLDLRGKNKTGGPGQTTVWTSKMLGNV